MSRPCRIHFSHPNSNLACRQRDRQAIVPAAQLMACSASPMLPLRWQLIIRLSCLVCPIAGSIAWRRFSCFLSALPVGDGQTHLHAKLVAVAGLALADAFHLGCVQGIAASFEAQRLAFLDEGLSQADPAALGRFEGRREASIARGCRKSIMASSRCRDRNKSCVSVIELTPENSQKPQHYCALLAEYAPSIFR